MDFSAFQIADFSVARDFSEIYFGVIYMREIQGYRKFKY